MHHIRIIYRFIFTALIGLYVLGGEPASAQSWTGAIYDETRPNIISLQFSEAAYAPKVLLLETGSPRLVLDWAKMSADVEGVEIGQSQHALKGQGPVNRFRYAPRGAEGLRVVFDLAPNAVYETVKTSENQLIVTFKGQYAPQPQAAPVSQSVQVAKFDNFSYNVPIPRVKPLLGQSVTLPQAQAQPQARPQPSQPIQYASLEIHTPAKRVFSKFERPYPRVAPHHWLGTNDSVQTAEQKPRKPVIVLDPGHGGYDPGAIGANGTKEKVITTAVTNRLAQRLRASGRYEVVLTRTKDVYVEHEDRLRIARERGADLFISIHADSTANGKAAGASVYTLADRSKGRSKNITHTQNWILDVDLSEQTASVGNILVDLAQRKTLSHSSQFAARLVGELENKVPLVRNTHRRAGYYVLLAPDVPAVLLELGFLSNASDEVRLNKTSEQDKLIQAVTRAINGFFSAEKQ